MTYRRPPVPPAGGASERSAGRSAPAREAGGGQQTDAFKKAAGRDEETDWSDQYMRLAMKFATGSPRYGFLDRSLFGAAGRLLGTGHIEYAVYRVD
jgi:hypothetical protein